MSELSQEDPNGKPSLQLEFARHNGILMHNGEIEEIKQVSIREDDIWVCTYPRSGVKHFNQMPSPRMMKSHMHYDFLPEQLQNGKGRIIYVARNPKDVVTPFYNLLLWLDEIAEEENTWKSFFQAFIDGKAIQCPWPRHVLKYWERRNDSNLLCLKFEDLVKDLPKKVRKIAAFLGRNLTDYDVGRICDHCSVENMRKKDKCNMAYWRGIKHINDRAPGKAGVWRQKLTAEESEKMDVLISEVEKFGLTFDHAK